MATVRLLMILRLIFTIICVSIKWEIYWFLSKWSHFDFVTCCVWLWVIFPLVKSLRQVSNVSKLMAYTIIKLSSVCKVGYLFSTFDMRLSVVSRMSIKSVMSQSSASFAWFVPISFQASISVFIKKSGLNIIKW